VTAYNLDVVIPTLVEADVESMKRFLVTLGAVSAAVLVAWLSIGGGSLGIDDAHIFFVYGENLAAGEGPAYNAGGEWVEGFTSLLWTIVVAAAFGLSDQPELWLLLFSIVAVSVAIVSLARLTASTPRRSWQEWVLLAWTVGSPSFVVWTSVALMDTAVWTMLLVLGVVSALSVDDSPYVLPATLAALVICRPESILWGPVLIGVCLVMTASKYGWGQGWIRARAALIGYGATICSLTLLRLAVFGYPLPNTYYAKVSRDIGFNLRLGAEYLVRFLYVNPPALVGLVPAISGVILNLGWFLRNVPQFPLSQEMRRRVEYLMCSLVVLVALGIPILTGGDYFNLFRFYQPAWPLILLPAFALIDVLKLEIPPAAELGLPVLVAVTVVTIPRANWINGDYRSTMHNEFEIAREGEAIGASLNHLFAPPRPTVGATAAGGIALEYEGIVFDLMGLNNTAMAHSPGDRRGIRNHAGFNEDVFFAQQPDILLPMIGTRRELFRDWSDSYRFTDLILKGLLDEDRFLDRYQLAILHPYSDVHILAWIRKGYLGTVLGRDIDVELVAPGDQHFESPPDWRS
jgi:arabinofuranosyltransferase